METDGIVKKERPLAKRSERVRINENARLMQRVADGDFDAFERLYRRFESHRSPKKGLKGRSEPIKDSPDGLSQPELELYLKELTAAIEQAKGKLTEAQRQALDAANALDIDLNDVSKEIGCSHSAFKSRLKRARKRLRELLAPFLNDENNS